MSKILVLGITGMLGSMVYSYLKLNKNLEIYGSYQNSLKLKSLKKDKKIFKFNALENISEQIKCNEIIRNPDYIINCIGVIKPYCLATDMAGIKKAILINSLLPHKISNIASKLSPKLKIIQIATDCVYSGESGNYVESSAHDPLDVYGKSKSLGEVIHPNFLNIRCSIIGHEVNNHLSLLEWFLSNHSGNEVNGYAHHLWNGITTLQFAQLCQYYNY